MLLYFLVYLLDALGAYFFFKYISSLLGDIYYRGRTTYLFLAAFLLNFLPITFIFLSGIPTSPCCLRVFVVAFPRPGERSLELPCSSIEEQMEQLVCRRMVYNPMSRGVGLNLPGGPSTNYHTYRDFSGLFTSSFKRYISYRVGAYFSDYDLLFFHVSTMWK